MANQQLIDYIKKEKARGVGEESIKSALVNAGWPVFEIEETLAYLGSNSLPADLDLDLPSLPESETAYSDYSPIKAYSSEEAKKVFSRGKDLRRTILTAVIAIAILAGLGAGAYVYYSQMPAVVLKKSLKKMEEVKSLSYALKVTVEPANNQPEVQETSVLLSGKSIVSLSGGIDANDPKNPKATVNLSFSEESNPSQPLMAMEMRLINKVFYARLANSSLFNQFGIEIPDQWLKIDFQALSDNEILKEQLKKQQGLENLSLEKQKEIEKLWNDELAKAAKKTSRLEDEEIDGVDCYHYLMPLDKEAIKNLINETLKIIGEESFTGEEKQEFEKAMEAIDFKDFDVWVGKKDLFMRKVFIKFSVTEAEENQSVYISEEISLKDFNQPISVQAPEESFPIEELLGYIFSGQPALTEEEQKDAAASVAMTNIQNEAEKIRLANNSYINLDCSFFSQYADIKSYCQEIDRQLGGYPTIRKAAVSPQSYCAFVILKRPGPNNGKRYFCVDSAGFAGETLINPAISFCTKTKFSCPK